MTQLDPERLLLGLLLSINGVYPANMADIKPEQTQEGNNNDHLVQSDDPEHPANLIPELCRKFYSLGWVTGTGGGVRRPPIAEIHPLPN